MDVRWRSQVRQHDNQLGGTRGKWEVELPAQREAATRQEAAVLTRGQEAEAAQQIQCNYQPVQMKARGKGWTCEVVG